MNLASLLPKLKTPAVILGMLAIWQVSVGLFKIPEFILPTPLVALEHLFLPQPDANTMPKPNIAPPTIADSQVRRGAA